MEKQKNKSNHLLLKVGAGFLLYKLYNYFRNENRRTTFTNKVVLISGGSRGLGLVLAKKLAAEGALLSLLARDEQELHEARKIILDEFPQASVLIQKCDSTNRDDVDSAVVKTRTIFGRLDAVINNAGLISVSPYENTTAEDFKNSLDTHFWAAYNVIEASLPFLKSSARARIINISSIGGKIPLPHLSAYCAGKHALVGYSKTLRTELIKDDIYVTTVSPGLIRTGSQGHAEFKGQVKKEYSWFTVGGSMPLLTVSAERTADKILQASRLGLAEAVISWPAQISTKFDALAPELTADLTAVANSLLPAANENSHTVLGKEAHSILAPKPLTTLCRRAAARNNEGSI